MMSFFPARLAFIISVALALNPYAFSQAGSSSRAAPSASSSAAPGKISVNFRDTPLRMVLKVFSLESGLNFVYSPAVAETKVTAQLNDISWDRALVGILASSSLRLKTIGQNIAQILPRTAAGMSAGQGMAGGMTGGDMPLPVSQQLQQTGRGGQTVFAVGLTYGSAVYLQPRLEAVFKDQDVTVVADEKANGLLIRCAVARKSAVMGLIAALDKKPVQVEIQSRIVEISTSQSRFAGVLLNNRLNFDPGRGLGFGTLTFPNAAFSNFAVDPGVSATNAAGNFNFKFTSLNRVFDLDLLLKLEEKKGNSKILQSSNLVVTNNEPARIESGLSDFFFGFSQNPDVIGGEAAQDPLGDGTTNLTEVRYTLSLEVTPEVTAAGEVLLSLIIVSDIPQASQFPKAVAGKSRRRIQTQMIRASGETAVIGGIYDKKLVTNVTRIPVLSDIPLIGPLFRSKSRSVTKTELVILVTPKIIYPKGQGAYPLSRKQTPGKRLSRRTTTTEPLPPIEAAPVPEQQIAPNVPLAPINNAETSQRVQSEFNAEPERDLPAIEAAPVPEAGLNAQQNLSPAEGQRNAGNLPPIEAAPVPEAQPNNEADILPPAIPEG